MIEKGKTGFEGGLIICQIIKAGSLSEAEAGVEQKIKQIFMRNRLALSVI
ncbi:MAG: hypothetical protein WCX74_01395 [Candidatus Paceibacterota bacterium]